MSDKAGIRYFIVDAFTNRPFRGNPAAVVPLENWKDDEWLQNVAMEMNLSETAFLVQNAGGYDLRWFTPTVEVDLCGHATLAAAKALSGIGKLYASGNVRFATRSGELRVQRNGDQFNLDFPIDSLNDAVAPEDLLQSLNIQAVAATRGRFDFLVEVESAEAVRRLTPDFKRLAMVDARGVIVTARSDDPTFDFVSRFFGPRAGIDEDPVTGSAHCTLAAYWGRKLGKSKMVGYQASKRSGIVNVEIQTSRVLLGGEAVIIAEGMLLVNE